MASRQSRSARITHRIRELIRTGWRALLPCDFAGKSVVTRELRSLASAHRSRACMCCSRSEVHAITVSFPRFSVIIDIQWRFSLGTTSKTFLHWRKRAQCDERQVAHIVFQLHHHSYMTIDPNQLLDGTRSRASVLTLRRLIDHHRASCRKLLSYNGTRAACWPRTNLDPRRSMQHAWPIGLHVI